jgi:hypothetical protein
MNRLKTLTLIGAIFAVTIGALSYSGTSATPLLMSSVPQAHDGIKALGHVEYVLKDADGLVKAYYQGDNLVVNQGDNCAAVQLFDPGSSGNGCDSFGTDGFQYIAIGNSTATFDDDSTNIGAAATDATDGEQARRQDTVPVFTQSSGTTPTGAQIVIETPTPFEFNASNDTTVYSAGLFDAAATHDTHGQTTTVTGKLFSAQRLNPTVTVSSGDTLNVKWTITIGTNDPTSP